MDSRHHGPPGITPPPGSRPPHGEEYFTLPNGCPIMHPVSAQRIGRQLPGTLLIQDTNMISSSAHFNRERIPDRVVHGRGAGAYGDFEVTHDISKFTSAAFLNKVGKKTPLFCRLSGATSEIGSPDGMRDIRGFAFKLYTEEGNLDWAFLNTPVFLIRDPVKFSSAFHAVGRNPQTGLKDASQLFDYFNLNAEGYGALMFLLSDFGTPVSFRYANIYSVNTYKFTKPDGSFHYVRIHMKTNQGVNNLNNTQNATIIAADPDYNTRDLSLAIENKNFPSWTVYAQVIDPVKAQKLDAPIFDATRRLSEKDFPLLPFGKITLNRIPSNFFAEVEQATFCPSSVVPGWDISPDPVLQLRLFAYSDTQRYRLGTNFNQLPINRPFYSYNPTIRNGVSNISNLGGLPGYIPSSFAPKIVKPAQVEPPAHEEWVGRAVNFESHVTDEDFAHFMEFWVELGEEKGQQENLVANVAGALNAAVESVRKSSYDIFGRIDKNLGQRVEQATEARVLLNESGQEIPGFVVGGNPVSG